MCGDPAAAHVRCVAEKLRKSKKIMCTDSHPFAGPSGNKGSVSGAHVDDTDRTIGASEAHHGVKPADGRMLELNVCRCVPVKGKPRVSHSEADPTSIRWLHYSRACQRLCTTGPGAPSG